MGIKTMRMARAFGVAAEVGDYNGVTFEDDFVNKKRTGFKTGSNKLGELDYFNRLFETAFNFTGFPPKKDDW